MDGRRGVIREGGEGEFKNSNSDSKHLIPLVTVVILFA